MSEGKETRASPKTIKECIVTGQILIDAMKKKFSLMTSEEEKILMKDLIEMFEQALEDVKEKEAARKEQNQC